MPTMMPVLATPPCFFTRRRSSRERSNLALGRTAGYMRRTVSRLWLMMCGSGVDHHLERGQLPSKSGISTSTDISGQALAGADDRLGPDAGAAVGELVAVDARDDDVLEPHEGERLGDAAGLVPVEVFGRPVLTLQKPQARVQCRRGS
jgi:hypothetical protein